MSKNRTTFKDYNRTTFSDVKPRARAAEMLLCVLIDNTGCLFKMDRIHFFSDADLSWLNRCFKPFLIDNWNAMHFMPWHLGPWLCSTPQFFTQAH